MLKFKVENTIILAREVFRRGFYSKSSVSKVTFQILKLLKTFAQWNVFTICDLHKEHFCISQLTHIILPKYILTQQSCVIMPYFALLIIIVLLCRLKMSIFHIACLVHEYIHSRHSMYMLPFQSPNLNFKTH